MNPKSTTQREVMEPATTQPLFMSWSPTGKPSPASSDAVSPVAVAAPIREVGSQMATSPAAPQNLVQQQLQFWSGVMGDGATVEQRPASGSKRAPKRRRRRSKQFDNALQFWNSIQTDAPEGVRGAGNPLFIEEAPPERVSVLETQFNSTRQLWESKTGEAGAANQGTAAVAARSARRSRKVQRERERRREINDGFAKLAQDLDLGRGRTKLDKYFILNQSRSALATLRKRNAMLEKEKKDMQMRIAQLTACLGSISQQRKTQVAPKPATASTNQIAIPNSPPLGGSASTMDVDALFTVGVGAGDLIFPESLSLATSNLEGDATTGSIESTDLFTPHECTSGL